MTKVSRNLIFMMLFKIIVSVGKSQNPPPFSPFFFSELPKSMVTGSLWIGREGAKKTCIFLFTLFFYIYVSVHTLYVGVCSCAVFGGQKRVSGVIFRHSRPVPVKQGLSLNLEIPGSLTLVRVIGMCRKSGLLCACWDLNSGPHDFTASTVTLAVDISKKKNVCMGWR